MLDKLETIFLDKKNYELEFKNAIKNTSKYGLGTYQPFKKTKKRLITDVSLQAFQEYTKHLNLTPDLLIAQCLGIHFTLKPYVDKFYGINSIITIGHIERKAGEKAFYEPMEKRIEYLSQPVDITKPINIHVWLTLPTLEILDFTLPTTLFYVLGKKEYEGRIIVQHGNDNNHFFINQNLSVWSFYIRQG